MVRRFSIFCLLFLGSSLVASTTWYSSVKEGFEIAEKDKKPIFIDLYADWCKYCKVLENEIYPAKEVDSELAKFVTIRLNGEEFPNLKQKFGVVGYPTILILDKNGVYLDKITGLPDKAMILKHLQAAYERKDIEETMLATLDDKDGKSISAYNLGIYYYNAQKFPESLKYFELATKEAVKAGDRKLQNDSFFNLALVQLEMGEMEKAKNQLKAFLQIGGIPKENQAAAHFYLAICYIELGDKSEAKKELNTVIELSDSEQDKEQARKMLQDL